MFCLSQGLKGPSTMSERTLLLPVVYSKKFAPQRRNLSCLSTPLTKPPRILTELLESLMIRCDYESRGCRELTKLEFLDRHVRSCGYSPTRCTNTGCTEVMNQHEKEIHESELCQFRKIVCDDCGEQITWKSSRLPRVSCKSK